MKGRMRKRGQKKGTKKAITPPGGSTLQKKGEGGLVPSGMGESLKKKQKKEKRKRDWVERVCNYKGKGEKGEGGE